MTIPSIMTEQILAKLKELKELDAHKEAVKLDKQAAIDSILTEEIKNQLRDIDARFDPITEKFNTTIDAIEADVKQMVLNIGSTVKGVYMAVYNRGRVSWNTKALDGYAAAHPEIEQFKKTGNPSVSIRRK